MLYKEYSALNIEIGQYIYIELWKELSGKVVVGLGAGKKVVKRSMVGDAWIFLGEGSR